MDSGFHLVDKRSACGSLSIESCRCESDQSESSDSGEEGGYFHR